MTDRNSESSAAKPESSESQPAETGAERQGRSTLERGISWGVIGGLSVVLLVEVWAYYRFNRAYDVLREKVGQADDSKNYVVEATVTEAVRGKKPSDIREVRTLLGPDGKRIAAERIDQFVWSGVFKKHTMYVHYGIAGKAGNSSEPEVMSVAADEPTKWASPAKSKKEPASE